MPDDDVLKQGFRTDLDELDQVVKQHLPDLGSLLQAQVAVFNRFNGVSPPTMSPGVDSAFYALNGKLRERMRKACAVVEATTEALGDIAALYRKADGRV